MTARVTGCASIRFVREKWQKAAWAAALPHPNSAQKKGMLRKYLTG
jgi:hypothetical protein